MHSLYEFLLFFSPSLLLKGCFIENEREKCLRYFCRYVIQVWIRAFSTKRVEKFFLKMNCPHRKTRMVFDYSRTTLRRFFLVVMPLMVRWSQSFSGICGSYLRCFWVLNVLNTFATCEDGVFDLLVSEKKWNFMFQI